MANTPNRPKGRSIKNLRMVWGFALRCRVDFETSYGPDHEVLSERYRIVEILEVLPAARPGAEAPSAAASQPQQREPARELETTS